MLVHVINGQPAPMITNHYIGGGGVGGRGGRGGRKRGGGVLAVVVVAVATVAVHKFGGVGVT